jgi:hypothetical protein
LEIRELSRFAPSGTTSRWEGFAGPLTRTDALYFTVTVFPTVGFGDITARSETARIVVTGQMIADLVIPAWESRSSWARLRAAVRSSRTTPASPMQDRLGGEGHNGPRLVRQGLLPVSGS